MRGAFVRIGLVAALVAACAPRVARGRYEPWGAFAGATGELALVESAGLVSAGGALDGQAVAFVEDPERRVHGTLVRADGSREPAVLRLRADALVVELAQGERTLARTSAAREASAAGEEHYRTTAAGLPPVGLWFRRAGELVYGEGSLGEVPFQLVGRAGAGELRGVLRQPGGSELPLRAVIEGERMQLSLGGLQPIPLERRGS